MTNPAVHFWRFDRVVAPTEAPVTVAEMHAHCRIDGDDTGQDALLELWLGGAVEYAEDYTQRSLLTQTWRATGDRFPVCGAEISLRRGPVQSVTSITYVDKDGATQTMDPALYVFDPSGLVPRIAPVANTSWPVTRQQLGAVKVIYVTGYGDESTDVPKTIRQWMQVRVGTQYENREEFVMARGKLEPLPFVDGLLDIYRVVPV